MSKELEIGQKVWVEVHTSKGKRLIDSEIERINTKNIWLSNFCRVCKKGMRVMDEPGYGKVFFE